MIFDHAFVLPQGLDPCEDICGSTLRAADIFSERLARAGFIEGSSRSHPGQGTANRRLFLSGVMIECLYVNDITGLDDERGAPLALGARFRNPEASGVGFAFRPDPEAPGELPLPSFASSAYRPGYLPAPLRIDIAHEHETEVPLLFHLPFARQGGVVADDGEPRVHPNGASRVAGVVLEQSVPFPDSAEIMLRHTGIECKTGSADECLHVRLHGLESRLELDMRPLFPLRLHS